LDVSILRSKKPHTRSKSLFPKGDYGTVEANVTIFDANQRMYNLTVEDAHTFFVGDGDWLVHNIQCDFRPRPDLDKVNNGNLRNLIEDDYRVESSLGSGGTATAVIEEIDTGIGVGSNTWHGQKALDTAKAYRKWLNRNPDAILYDRQLATQLYNQLVVSAQYAVTHSNWGSISMPQLYSNSLQNLSQYQTFILPTK